MSTRSRIAIKTPTNIQSIYCHFDGYLDAVGETLVKYYSSEEKALDLIGLGDISSLGSTIEKTVAYCRDRGEELNIKFDASDKTLIKDFLESDQEYLYLYDGEWKVLTKSGWESVAEIKLKESL